MSRYERLTDEQWAILSPLIPPSPVRADLYYTRFQSMIKFVPTDAAGRKSTTTEQ